MAPSWVAGSAVVLRHVAFEDLGVFEPLLRARYDTVRYVDVGIDPIGGVVDDAALLVVLGGPIGLADTDRYPYLLDELDALRRRLDRRLPTLGVCLGAQLVAAALGAGVEPTGRVEIGYSPLTLTPAGRRSVLASVGDTPVLHWHGDQFDVPDGAELLASTPGFPNQAFSLGDHVLALQFHLEADPARIEQWLIGHAHELTHHRIDPAAIRQDAARHGPELAERARGILTSWLDLDR